MVDRRISKGYNEGFCTMKETHLLKVKLLNNKIGTEIPIPCYETIGSAGMDLRACLDKNLTINPGETHLIPSGIAVHINNPNYAGIILPRSGLGHKHGIVLGNLVGLIDSDYQGEIKVSCWNRGLLPFIVEVGARIAQFVLIPVLQVQLEIVHDFQEISLRGEAGFGHTGHR